MGFAATLSYECLRFSGFQTDDLKIIHLLVAFHIKFRLNSLGTKRQEYCCCIGVRGRSGVKDALFFPTLSGGMGEPNAEVKVVNEEAGIVFGTCIFFLMKR